MRRLRGLVGLCAAAVLVAAPAAQAANLIPNAGFESDCSGTPCQWAVFGSALVSTDAAIKHTGSFSLQVRADASLTGAISTPCVAITAGTYSSGFWFSTTAPGALSVHVAAQTYTNDQCDFFHVGPFRFGASKTLTDADRDGAWHFVSGPIDLSSAAAVQFEVLVQCDACPATVNFDDVSVDAAATAVTVTAFAASRTGRDVLVRWRTRAEAGVLGFRIYRDGRLLTRRIVLASGAPSGNAYRFRDRNAPRAARTAYRLELVGLDGAARFAARAVVQPGGPLLLAP